MSGECTHRGEWQGPAAGSPTISPISRNFPKPHQKKKKKKKHQHAPDECRMPPDKNVINTPVEAFGQPAAIWFQARNTQIRGRRLKRPRRPLVVFRVFLTDM